MSSTSSALMSNVHKMIDINHILISKDRRHVTRDDAQGMASSIKEHGLIQPIVIAKILPHNNNNNDRYQLVAGGHRIAAMRILGWQFLEHFVHFVLRDEDTTTTEGRLRLGAVELEENLRRKQMSWPETVEAKQRLLDMMEIIHGETGPGRPTNTERVQGEVKGFGVRKLAAMLGESIGTVSQDLQLARMVRSIPALAQAENKSSAIRQGTIKLALHAIKKGQAAKADLREASNLVADVNSVASAPAIPKYEVYEGKWEDNIHAIADNSIDLIYTDLPYGVNLNNMSSHQKGALSYSDSRESVLGMLPRLLNQAFRVLKDNKYAVFWFGFNYYSELVEAVKHAGFEYNPVPIIWLKHRQATENPIFRYANAYEQAIVCWKGSAKFIRPGQANIVDVPAVAVGEKIQAAQQPPALVDRFIKDMLLVGSGARVVDFCAGSGTTGVVTLLNGHYPILFERDPDQVLIAKQRCENATKASPVLPSRS